MNVHLMLAAIAGAVAMHTAAAQSAPAVPGVSMRVVGGIGAVGYMCEPFACAPSALPVASGETLVLDLYGLPQQPYILFAGVPSPSCFALDWLLGELASAPPWLIVDVGFIPASGAPSPCGMGTMQMKLPLPDPVPTGAEVTLQLAAWSFRVDMPALSRAVTLTVQ